MRAPLSQAPFLKSARDQGTGVESYETHWLTRRLGSVELRLVPRLRQQSLGPITKLSGRLGPKSSACLRVPSPSNPLELSVPPTQYDLV